MRIRKRQVPFHLSSLSPVPLSDPHFSRSPVVQLQLDNDPHQNLSLQANTAACFASQASDQPIGGGSEARACSDGDGPQEEKKVLLGKDERWGEREESNDIRKGSFCGAKAQTEMVPQHSTSSRRAVGRWGEGERAFPLKKRRGSFERRSNEEKMVDKDKKMKTKMNEKCVQQDGNEGEEKEDKETKEVVDGSNSAKKRGRGGALMEGSRCSRVNGRGWRCCQQTLVGYSLCEHHLGKGRLRSMSSVRSRSMASTATKKAESQPLPSPSLSIEEKETKRGFEYYKVDGENEDGEGKKPLMMSTKKMKLGMVKARSISSLMGQANNAIAVAEDSK